VFVKTCKKLLPIAKALAYCTAELITALKGFVIPSPAAFHVEFFYKSNNLNKEFNYTEPSSSERVPG
jgi:hypothetical protein